MNMYFENRATVEKLKALFESELYQNLLNEFAKRSKCELDNQHDANALFEKLKRHCHRCYLFLRVPFDEVLLEFERSKDNFLEYQLAASAYFGENDKSEFGEKSLIDKTYLIERFCEFYLLQKGDKNRLWGYLLSTKVPHVQKYAEQITELYEQTLRQKNASRRGVIGNARATQQWKSEAGHRSANMKSKNIILCKWTHLFWLEFLLYLSLC
jgi:hypothetical protein